MPIAPGRALPHASFTRMTKDGPRTFTTEELFSGKTAVLFAVPGAFTPTCHLKHIPGFVQLAPQMKAKGADFVACTSVNDIFVLEAWSKHMQPDHEVIFLADGNAEFAKAIGMELDASGFGMGVRSKRYAMIVKDGIVKVLGIDETPGVVETSSAESILKAL